MSAVSNRQFLKGKCGGKSGEVCCGEGRCGGGVGGVGKFCGRCGKVCWSRGKCREVYEMSVGKYVGAKGEVWRDVEV